MGDESVGLFRKLSELKAHSDPGNDLISFCTRHLGPLEPLYYDYKQKHDTRTPELEADDKRNIAKAVSGFANSQGGVLIFGIEDKTLKAKPIPAVATFMQNALELGGQCVVPGVDGLSAEWIPSVSGSSDGFGILHVPESDLPPHQVILKDREINLHYYMRIGTFFERIPHFHLESMFGRRPKPVLSVFFAGARKEPASGGGHWEIRLEVRNCGRGSAIQPVLVVDLGDKLISTHSPTEDVFYRPSTLFSPNGHIRKWIWPAIHPGMSEMAEGIGIRERDRDAAPQIAIRYRIFCENAHPVSAQCDFPFPDKKPEHS